MKKIVTAILLILMICGLCACKMEEQELSIDPSATTASQNDVGTSVSISVTAHDCSQYTDEQMETIRNWWQCPIEQSLYTLVYEETSIYTIYEIPEVLDGYWTVEDYHNDADRTVNVEELTARDTYNFTLFIYDNQKEKLYQISYNNEE